MKELLKLYNTLSEEQKENLEGMYVLKVLDKKLIDNSINEFTEIEKDILFNKIIECLKISNIKIEEIISRILNVIGGPDITVQDINDIELEELINLLSNEDSDFKEIEKEKEILTALKIESEFNEYYCLFIKHGKKIIFSYIKSNGIQKEKIFIDKDKFYRYIAVLFLEDLGEDIRL